MWQQPGSIVLHTFLLIISTDYSYLRAKIWYCLQIHCVWKQTTIDWGMKMQIKVLKLACTTQPPTFTAVHLYSYFRHENGKFHQKGEIPAKGFKNYAPFVLLCRLKLYKAVQRVAISLAAVFLENLVFLSTWLVRWTRSKLYTGQEWENKKYKLFDLVWPWPLRYGSESRSLHIESQWGQHLY